MTTFGRFDPFERRITEAIDEIAAARPPDYLTDILRQTARKSQRPRWTFPERWISVDTALSRPGLARSLPVRPLLILALIALLALAAAAYIGSRRHVPLPFGPADNGALAYTQAGDIYVRDGVTGVSHVLVSTPGADAFPFFSPDGTMVGFSTTSDTGGEYLKVANADGTNVRQLLPDPIISAGAAWRPDSHAMAVDTTVLGLHKLLIVPVDGSAVTEIDLGSLEPMSVAWRPPSGDALLFRAENKFGEMDLYTVKADGTGLHALNLPGKTVFGSEYTLSGGTFSPDGGTIAYNSIELDGVALVTHFRVGLILPDGTRATMPGPDDPRIQEAWPAFSPDGKWILVHRWVFKSDSALATPEGWLAIMPADGSAPTRDIGPRIPGGEDSGLSKIWSPDGSRILMRAGNTLQVFSIDPISGEYDQLPWTTELPDWQRVSLH